jgi:hypothetical protein
MHSNCRKACGACVVVNADDEAPLFTATAAATFGSRGSLKVASSDAVHRATVLAGKGEAIMHTDEPGAKVYFHKAVKLAPNKLALLQLGRMGINNQEAGARAAAYAHLERAFDEDCIPEPVDINSIQGYYLANIISRCTLSVVVVFAACRSLQCERMCSLALQPQPDLRWVLE